jgi:hypothetical protein
VIGWVSSGFGLIGVSVYAFEVDLEGLRYQHPHRLERWLVVSRLLHGEAIGVVRHCEVTVVVQMVRHHPK